MERAPLVRLVGKGAGVHSKLDCWYNIKPTSTSTTQEAPARQKKEETWIKQANTEDMYRTHNHRVGQGSEVSVRVRGGQRVQQQVLSVSSAGRQVVDALSGFTLKIRNNFSSFSNRK